ncbi:MAG: FGGY-family carbohydrate kinase [Acetobacteraceae bacterium]|nr:FGGY-family carbohydrate kinase [Acetobacteraceae bacterium]
MSGFVLAADLGGSSWRAALLDAAARPVAQRALPALQGSAPEIAPEAWWRGFLALAEGLAAEDPRAFRATSAVAVTALTRAPVFLDAAGEVLAPAPLPQDPRAEAVLPALLSRLPEGDPERARVNAFHPLARLVRFAAERPEAARRLAAVLDPKDFLNLRLTGRAASDPISSARLLASRTLLSAAGFHPSILPALCDPVSVMGRVRPGLPGALSALAGVPVVAMASDSWAAVLGLGALRPGFGYIVSGTTEVAGLISARPASAEGLIGLPWGEGLHQLGGPSQAGGDTLAWLRALLRCPPEEEEERLLAEPPHPEPLLFLPHLMGERAPYWDAGLRGAFLGLSRAHGAADLLRAAVESLGFLNRLVIERAEAAAGLAAQELRLGGGGARSAAALRIRAEALGRPLALPAAEEPGLTGAAIAAWTALGRFPSLAEAQAALSPPARILRPERDRSALFALWRRAAEAVAPLSRALSAPGLAGAGARA